MLLVSKSITSPQRYWFLTGLHCEDRMRFGRHTAPYYQLFSAPKSREQRRLEGIVHKDLIETFQAGEVGRISDIFSLQLPTRSTCSAEPLLPLVKYSSSHNTYDIRKKLTGTFETGDPLLGPTFGSPKDQISHSKVKLSEYHDEEGYIYMFGLTNGLFESQIASSHSFFEALWTHFGPCRVPMSSDSLTRS